MSTTSVAAARERRPDVVGPPEAAACRGLGSIAVALLTGGGDKPYVFGLTKALISTGASVELIGSDDLDHPEFHNTPGVQFLNLRGDQRSDANIISKVRRVARYYAKLIRYAAIAKPLIFHVLWNNKCEMFDRTLLLLYYKCLGKRIVLTAHNVNAGKRDSKDTVLNRLTLRIQYHLTDHIFVHTEKMRRELIEDFGVQGTRVSVVPLGINNAVPNTGLMPTEAKRRLNIRNDERTLLFFGRITPYKGVEYLIDAFRELQSRGGNYRLIIAGKPESESYGKYWVDIKGGICEEVRKARVLLRAEFIPDDETEIYFKAADVLVLPYKDIYQSGVLFLGYSFGLPVLAADVGSLKDDIVEGETGFLFKPEDATSLASTIAKYFASDLFVGLDGRRRNIREYAAKRNSWEVVGQTTISVYAGLLRGLSRHESESNHRRDASADVNTSL